MAVCSLSDRLLARLADSGISCCIATASEEQSASSEEIARSVEHVNTIASETSQAMGEASKAVSELAAQAQNLSRIITHLKNS